MDLVSTGSNISKYKLDTARLVAIKEKLDKVEEVKEIKDDSKDENKALSMDEFLDDFKI